MVVWLGGVEGSVWGILMVFLLGDGMYLMEVVDVEADGLDGVE